jgi:alcohol dehydrogenase, propanol-preferring
VRRRAYLARSDAHDFLQLAAGIGLRPKVTACPLNRANEALQAVASDSMDGAAAIVP